VATYSWVESKNVSIISNLINEVTLIIIKKDLSISVAMIQGIVERDYGKLCKL
jgi:hypothetical protein